MKYGIKKKEVNLRFLMYCPFHNIVDVSMIINEYKR